MHTEINHHEELSSENLSLNGKVSLMELNLLEVYIQKIHAELLILKDTHDNCISELKKELFSHEEMK